MVDQESKIDNQNDGSILNMKKSLWQLKQKKKTPGCSKEKGGVSSVMQRPLRQMVMLCAIQ